MPVTRELPAPGRWTEFLRSAPDRERVELTISDRARSLVAAPPDLGDKYRADSGTLLIGGRQLSDAMARGTRDVQREFHDLGAEFVYPLAPLLNEIRIQSGLLVLLADTLNVFEEKFGVQLDAGMRRRWVEARELYVEGCGKAAEMLFPEALEWLLKAEERYPTDFTIQFQLGWVRLYGVSPDDSVVDLAQAEHHLRLAARYGKGAVRRRPGMAAPTAEALLHLGIACRLQAGTAAAGGPRVQEALEFAAEARQVNPKLSQAYYHEAKYAAALGDLGRALESALAAIGLDRRFALTADSDPDLAPLATQLNDALVDLRDRERLAAEAALGRLGRLAGLEEELQDLAARRAQLNRELERITVAGTNSPLDHLSFPGRVIDARSRFDNEQRGARRMLEKTDALAERAALSVAEAGRLAGRARERRQSGTLFAQQDVLPLAAEARTPLKRAESNLADARQLLDACAGRLPGMDSLLPEVVAERQVNRRAYRRWQLVEALRGAGRLSGRYAAGGALVGVIARTAWFFAGGEFQAVGFQQLLDRVWPLALAGAAAGALAGAAWSFRGFVAGLLLDRGR